MSRTLYRRTGEGPPDALFTSADGEVEGWLAGAGSRPAEPVRYVFADVVAGWFGTQEMTVKKWHTRYEGCPQAAAELAPLVRGGKPRLGWPAATAEASFRGWRATLPGQGAKGTEKPGAGRRMKHGPAVKALIGAGVADDVLSAFPFRAPVGALRDTRDAEDAAGGRLIVTGAGDDRMLYARDLVDAASASEALPGLVFYQVEVSGGAG